MLTTKPFSTISYNSIEFLVQRLDELLKRHEISFYAFVYHYAEADENGKNHIHLWCIPDKRLDTSQFRDYFNELDVSNPLSPPLGVMPCRSSVFGDWYLYSCHNREYLAAKGQTRQYHYEQQDFFCSSFEYLNELVHTIDHSKYRKLKDFLTYVDEGQSFEYLVRQGFVPINQLTQWEKVYNMMRYEHVRAQRNGRETHNPTDCTIDGKEIE